MNKNNQFVSRPSDTPRKTPVPLGQPPPQPAQPGHSEFLAVAQHPQSSRFQKFQTPLAPAYNLQRTDPHPSQPPPPQHKVFDPNDDYDFQWHGQPRYQQREYHIPPPVAQPLPQLGTQPN